MTTEAGAATNQGFPVPSDDDVRLVIARMEGMLQAVLPQHAARLDEHDRAITNMAAIVTQQGQDIAAVKAVATERATAKRTVPVGWQIAGVIVAVAAVVVTVILFAFER